MLGIFHECDASYRHLLINPPTRQEFLWIGSKVTGRCFHAIERRKEKKVNSFFYVNYSSYFPLHAKHQVKACPIYPVHHSLPNPAR
jgi:hypothetical protein